MTSQPQERSLSEQLLELRANFEALRAVVDLRLQRAEEEARAEAIIRRAGSPLPAPAAAQPKRDRHGLYLIRGAAIAVAVLAVLSLVRAGASARPVTPAAAIVSHHPARRRIVHIPVTHLHRGPSSAAEDQRRRRRHTGRAPGAPSAAASAPPCTGLAVSLLVPVRVATRPPPSLPRCLWAGRRPAMSRHVRSPAGWARGGSVGTRV